MDENKKEQHLQLKNALFEFVLRVLKGEKTSEAEVAILPEVVKMLLTL